MQPRVTGSVGMDHQWAIEQAKAGHRVRRASWPFFFFLTWGALGLTWKCICNGSPGTGVEPASVWCIGQSVAWPSVPPIWADADDWEVADDPAWRPAEPGPSPEPQTFVQNVPGVEHVVILVGEPPADAVRRVESTKYGSVPVYELA